VSVRSFFRPLYSPAQMQEIDRTAIETLGVPSLELMENAGRGAAGIIADLYREWECTGTVLILCGPGNNGGDGLVVARYLRADSIPVRVVLFAAADKLKGDPAANLERLQEAGQEVEFEPSGVELGGDTAVIVDALLGTGATGALREPYSAWAQAANESDIPVVAIDAPSGVDMATGAVAGEAFRAQATVGLAELKAGYFQFPARDFVGRVYPLEIGIPAKAADGIKSDVYLITHDGVAELLPGRPLAGHKGTFGRVAVIGGSVGMTGAAVMAAESALRAGCGLVTLGVPASLNDICEVKSTEVLTRPLPELKHHRCLAARSVGDAQRLANEADACVLGCGVGRNHETQECIGRLVERIEAPLVLDADGLFPFGADPDRLVRHRAPLVITPHPGELSTLLGVPVSDIQRDRVGSALRAARHFDCVCVLKGATTVVGTITGQAYLNPTGNSGMGTGGSGDVLAGLIGSLIAQGMSVLGAATAGVYIHGLAGDLAAHSWGERGMVAGDILYDLPGALQVIEESEPPLWY